MNILNPDPLSAAHRIGIDIGRVLIEPTDESGSADTSFLSGSEARALSTPPAPCAFEAVARIVRHVDGRAWLVSKCGPRIESLTRRWLDRHAFFERTGLAREHLRSCRARPEKRTHAEELRLTHFIDDRLDVLDPMRGLVPGLILFGHQPAGVAAPDGVTPALDWPSVLAVLGLVEDAQELRRDVLGEPDAVGRQVEDVPGLGHRARVDAQDDGRPMSRADAARDSDSR